MVRSGVPSSHLLFSKQRASICTRTLQSIQDTSKDACTYNDTSWNACTYKDTWTYNDTWQDTCTYIDTCTYNNTRRVAEGRHAPETCMTHMLEPHMFHTRVEHMHTHSAYTRHTRESAQRAGQALKARLYTLNSRHTRESAQRTGQALKARPYTLKTYTLKTYTLKTYTLHLSRKARPQNTHRAEHAQTDTEQSARKQRHRTHRNHSTQTVHE